MSPFFGLEKKEYQNQININNYASQASAVNFLFPQVKLYLGDSYKQAKKSA